MKRKGKELQRSGEERSGTAWELNGEVGKWRRSEMTGKEPERIGDAQ